MSNKQEKKLRQQYRRELQPKFHDFNLSIDRLIRPKPKYFPKWLWFRLQSKFINFPAGHEYWTEKMKELRGHIPAYWPEAQQLPAEESK